MPINFVTNPQVGNRLIYAGASDGGVLTLAGEQLLAPSTIVIPPNFMTPGAVLRAVLFGRCSSAITTPGTLTLTVRWNSTLLATSGAMAQVAASTSTNLSWWWEQYLICRTATSLISFGTCHRGNAENAASTNATPDLIPASAPQNTSLDLTIPGSLTFNANPSLATASILCHAMVVEALN